MYKFITIKILVLVVSLSAISVSAADTLNGFTIASKALDSKSLIKIGAPNKLPTLTNPKFISTKDAQWHDDDAVVAISINDQARAYPISILNQYAMVNDEVAKLPILILFCNRCGSATIYERVFDDKDLIFNSAGLLYRDDELFYDNNTKSLWSSYLDEAVSGPLEGQKLTRIPSIVLSWKEWKQEFPNATVLDKPSSYVTPNTSNDEKPGFYNKLGPYAAYHPKMPVTAIQLPDGSSHAYPAGEIIDAGGKIEDEILAQKFTIGFDSVEQKFSNSIKKPLTHSALNWGDWISANPEGTWFIANIETDADSKEH